MLDPSSMEVYIGGGVTELNLECYWTTVKVVYDIMCWEGLFSISEITPIPCESECLLKFHFSYLLICILSIRKNKKENMI